MIRDLMRWLDNETLGDRILLDVKNYNYGDLGELYRMLKDYYERSEKK